MCYFVSGADGNHEHDQLTNDIAGLKVDMAGLKDDMSGLKDDMAGLKVDLNESNGQMRKVMGWLKTTFGRIEETLKTISGGRNICNVTIMFLLRINILPVCFKIKHFFCLHQNLILCRSSSPSQGN